MRMMKRLLRAAGLLGLAAALWLAMLELLSWEHGMTAEDAAPLTALYLCAWGMALAFRRQGRSRRRGARIAWGLAGTALSVVLWLGLTLALGAAGVIDEKSALLFSGLFWAAWGAFFVIRRTVRLRRADSGDAVARRTAACGADEGSSAGRSAQSGTRGESPAHGSGAVDAVRREGACSAGDETRLDEARPAAADGEGARGQSSDFSGMGRSAGVRRVRHMGGARRVRRAAACCAAGALLIAALAAGGRYVARPVEIPEALEVFAQKYPEAADFVNDYPAHYRDHPSKDVSGEVKKGVVPLFIQWDERWGYEDYGGNYLAVNGCGPTCLSMVVCGLTGETDANPYAVACYSEEQGYYTPGSGTSWALMTRGAAHYGLDAARVDVSADVIADTLAQGRVIIASMKPGDFTYTGHFIVLTGLDRDGRVRVNDSNSRINSAKSWDAQVLVDQMKGAWSYSYNE